MPPSFKYVKAFHFSMKQLNTVPSNWWEKSSLCFQNSHTQRRWLIGGKCKPVTLYSSLTFPGRVKQPEVIRSNSNSSEVCLHTRWKQREPILQSKWRTRRGRRKRKLCIGEHLLYWLREHFFSTSQRRSTITASSRTCFNQPWRRK